MSKRIARTITGLETEDKYRLFCLPPKRYLRNPENISQGYFEFRKQEILTLAGHGAKCSLHWKSANWQAHIPNWVKEILKHSEKREFRIRKSVINGRTIYYGAVKSEGRLTRKEWQVRLPKELAESLWPLTEECRIFKTRYTIKLKFGRVIHLDVFEQTLSGLIIAEVESPSEKSACDYLSKGGPANMLGSCVLVTYDTKHRHRKLMTATQCPALPVLFSRGDKQKLCAKQG